MLFAEVEDVGPTSMTDVLRRWGQGHSVNGVAEERSALVVQLGRYVNGHKNCTAVDFEQMVEVPTFCDGVATQTRPYMVHSAIVHQGPRPTSGHYRSLLRLGNTWGYSDDGRPAQRICLSQQHRRDVYVLLLVPVAQA